jgi:hypothetical protein
VSERYTFTIPTVPPSFNVYDRWRPVVQRIAKRQWESDVLGLCNQKGNKAPRGIKQANLRAVIYFTTDRGRDGDNYFVPFWKWTMDGLRYAGVLTNDTDELVKPQKPVLSLGSEEQSLVVMEWEA